MNATIETQELRIRFEELKSRVNRDLLGMRDMYISKDHKHLFYYPIAFTDFETVISKRTRLENSGVYELVAVELVYKEILRIDPDNPRRIGCFRKTEWRNRNFNTFPQPKVMKKVKEHLEKDSKWLCGGPKPSEEYTSS